MVSVIADKSTNDLRAQYVSLVKGMIELNEKVDAKLKLLEGNKGLSLATRAGFCLNIRKPSTKVSLNVGGQLFAASEDVFLCHQNNYFYDLLVRTSSKPDEDGAYFIDRDPKHFNRIMTSLRSNEPVDFTDLSEKEKEQLDLELDFYSMPPRLKWDASRCARELTLSDGGFTVTCQTTHNVGAVGVLGTARDVPRFKVRVSHTNSNSAFMVGFAQGTKFNVSSLDWSTGWGWFFMRSGMLQNGCIPQHSVCPKLQVGDVVTVIADPPSISFAVNGIAVGSIEMSTYSGPIYPCVFFLRPEDGDIEHVSLSLLQ